MDDLVRYELDGKVATLTLDDGKANALSPEMVAAIGAALDRAQEEAGAVVLTGRPGRFCAGFDLRVLTAGADKARPLVEAGAALFMRLYGFPRPVIAACTGHALAGGALLLLCSDWRAGVRGPFKIGLNEVAIGIPLPVLVQRLAGDRLDARRVSEAILLATIYDPDGAAAVGYLDEAVDEGELLPRAQERATALTRLPRRAFAQSKASMREASISIIREGLEGDLDKILMAGQA
ncbi:MAG: crotonase/enoyl-CoA hydratase family protein [Myxococcales bacterium]|nr:crotonase/enoyl-CoA hydratase family protein [Myxococcales bacterium]